jgi:ribosomal-protein-alanine N-acetyltransferase
MSVAQMTQSYVRWMIRRDLDSVLAIENEAFGRHAWTQEEFLIALRQRNCIGMVAERNEEVVGYMVYELHKTSLELLNFAVRGRSQRLGVGTSMIEKLKAKLCYQRRDSIVLELRERNLEGQLFFRKAGFICTSILHGWYADDEESTAYQMQHSIDGGCIGV